ncbi:MAG: hypothetical protein OEX19_16720, partial [Gammaproteobacteria bacterium]|nr:hypothetical protein [Gammaproteobacteria bacterium]
MGIVKKILPIFPLLVIVSAFLGYAHTNRLSEHYLALAPQLPIIILTLSILLSLHFRNSNTFFISIVLALAYTFWNNLTGITSPSEQVLTQACIALLLPLNISFFSIVQDRGIATLSGFLKALLLLGQIFTVAWLNDNHSAATMHWLNMQWINIDNS